MSKAELFRLAQHVNAVNALRIGGKLFYRPIPKVFKVKP